MKAGSPLISDKKLHVFIADDDIDDIEFFRGALLETAGNVRITVASDGLELIEFLHIVTPNIIFLDINMPCLNGIDCLTEIRKMKALDLVPVIIYSTASSKFNIEKTYELGASMYFEKPASFGIIKQRLSEILSLKVSELLPQLPKEKFVLRA